jgi:hypothetical protein
MGLAVCILCLFTFPPPAPELKDAVEQSLRAERGPWSEVAGPFAKLNVHMLTEDLAVVDADVRWYGSMIVSAHRYRRFLARKQDGEWILEPLR